MIYLKNFLCCFLLFFVINAGAQNPWIQKTNYGGNTGYAKLIWTTNDPFEQKVFIENNEGQFNGSSSSPKEKVLFSTTINGIYLYFSATGVTYRYDKYPAENSKKKETGQEKNTKPETHFFSISWEGANQNTEIEAKDEVSFYYTYSKGNNHTTIAHAFRRLLYKNIYPGIDIEYSLPDGKKGLEYSIIVHPNADLSLVKMLYSDAKNIDKNLEGDIESESSFGGFIDHAPAKSYYLNTDGAVSCSFNLKNKEVTYSANYDHTKTLVIDPWIVSPGFSNYNAGYDVCYDLRGNVYAYGSFSPYQEIKINSNGVIQWIYTIPNADPAYADFAVDEATGISYDANCTFPHVYKVDTAGLQTGSYYINNSMEELWRMAFNKCENQLVLAGGGTGLTNQACLLDTGLTVLQTFNVLSTAEAHHDVSLLAIDNTNRYIYLAFMESSVSGLFNNVLLQCALPNLNTVSYMSPDGYSFIEGPCINYIDGVSGHTASMNGAVASPNWLYLYDGATLKRCNKNTGAIISSKTISPTKFSWGGIDVDLCDNIYLAKSDTIMVYDSSLNNIGKILAPNTIYDLHIAPNNILVATGLHFVSTFTITTNSVSISIVTVPITCNSPKGKATASISSCGNNSSSYNYQWSNGATTQTDTGLVAGTYTVSISTGCDFVYTDTVTIPSSTTDGMVLSTNQTNVLCNGSNDGSVTVMVSGGAMPFTYSWAIIGNTTQTVSNLSVGTYTVNVNDINGGCATADITITQPLTLSASLRQNNIICNGMNNGTITTIVTGGSGAYTYTWAPLVSTTDSAINLSAGTYTVTIKDSNGCVKNDIVTITQPAALTNTITPLNISCYGLSNGSATVSASGGTGPYTYSWAPSGGSNSIASGLSAGTYTVNIKDSRGCLKVDSVTLTQPAKITPTISAPSTICPDSSITLTASGGGTYLWSNSATTSSISVNPSSTTTYTVKVSNGGCSKDTSVKVTVNPGPHVTLTAPPIICSDSTIILTVTGGGNYLWSNSATTSTITINPSSTITYSVQVQNGGCSKDTSVKITVNSTPHITITAPPTICSDSSITLISFGGGTYLWSNSSTTSGITINPNTTTTYSVEVKNGGCSKDTSVKVTVNPAPHVTLTAPPTICSDSSVTITVTGGGTYRWNTSATTSTITVNPSSTITYSVEVANGGCTKDTTVKVTVNPIPTVTLAGSTSICYGNTTTIDATGGGSYLWNTSATTSSISITPPSTTTYSLTVDKNGCIKDTTIKITVNLLPTVILSGSDTICKGASTNLDASGGTTYLWSTTATTSAINVSPTSTTTYTVGVNNGTCIKDTMVQVVVNPLPIPIITGKNALCKGSDILLTVSGGTIYSWSPSGRTTDTITVNPTTATIYTVTATNAFGCISDTVFKVSVNIPAGSITGPNSVCPGDTIELIAHGGGTYNWNTGATGNSISVTPLSNTTYTVVVNNGCIDTVTRAISVDAAPQLYACCDTIVSAGTPVVLNASGTLTYQWLPSAGVSCATCPDPVVTPTITTTYTVIGTDSSGCRIEKTLTVDVGICTNLIIPNVFTPNGDDVNDEFVINSQATSAYSIIIYDRWGKEMYQSTTPDLYWNGKDQHDNSFVPTGVYYYIIKYTCSGKSYTKDGFVQVIR